MNNLSIIILAAGKGTRMNSDLPKVLHKLNGAPLINYCLETSRKLNPEKIVVIVGHKKEEVIEATKNYGGISYAEQKEQLGTGHAVKSAEEDLKDFEGDVLVLFGDVPMISVLVLEKILESHRTQNASCTVLTAKVDNPFNYGRIIRAENGDLVKIVEEKDATDEEKQITEINSGIMLFQTKELFKTLNLIKNNNAKGEYYLTDAIEILVTQNKRVIAYTAPDYKEVLGVNTPEQLEELEHLYFPK